MSTLSVRGEDPHDMQATDPEGRKVKVFGQAPAVVMTNPKYAHNLGQVVRACSAFDIKQLFWTGDRVLKELEHLGDRIPREERMKGYKEVQILHHDRPLDLFKSATPVAVEVRPGSSEDLPSFIHPANAVYVFGPEDGSIESGILRECHRFVYIPMKHCANLAGAAYMVLYDRMAKERLGQQEGEH